MAMGGRMGVVLLVVLASLLVQCVVKTEAGFEANSMVEFTSPSGLADEDLSEWAEPEDEFLDEPTRRMLAGRSNYISYGALRGNRAPCPSRSGRSYYTPNCNSQGGRAQPYRRGCYQITRCARG